jgi:hypothetical protein
MFLSVQEPHRCPTRTEPSHTLEPRQSLPLVESSLPPDQVPMESAKPMRIEWCHILVLLIHTDLGRMHLSYRPPAVLESQKPMIHTEPPCKMWTLAKLVSKEPIRTENFLQRFRIVEMMRLKLLRRMWSRSTILH